MASRTRTCPTSPASAWRERCPGHRDPDGGWRRGYAAIWLLLLLVGLFVGSFAWATDRWP